ncbi:Mur ligase family protein [Ruminococcus flavefaciens]|uniref:UDP-N-acetylmuramoyl-tripeptide--D-alanyl-D-alanine ligase n=1 Tax=Ruminococcus flavefaciens TaxID=1265 RepID=A0A315XV63_RUMFL|nr:UDP-N-acetylmuramoyl-tripeptide--D-alanyl-D-alanine ligase [Ruminococcus flavefaciens]PWJ10998.1 UDP-N-acetylmuramoyl-tripeptide--D-alanyl-D-alanine ligase [Ruminococcus flavefaciens]SSA51072.1 UDP-N-acetylmuramoyl-tripeptide--D-alanyl-D-alanine ligase [Ruminococcus flavefaciens]
MNIVLFVVYAVIALGATVFLGLREFHMLQLNGYKTPEHSRWMKKNAKRYILPAVLFVVQFALLFLHSGAAVALIIVLSLFNIMIGLLNKPGKKFKKPLVYTARMKRMMVTFCILVAVYYVIAVLKGETTVYICRIWNEAHTEFTYDSMEKRWFANGLPYILAGSALYVTPLLVPLSNLINKPVEKAVQNWYINDAKRILSECPTLHKVGITGSYGKTSMKFYLDELLNSQYNTLKTPESFNTPMGVTITIRRDLKPTHEYFICEMGARRVHEIKELCGIADPHDGIITSVGPQHLETFGSIDNVLNTKFELADHVKAKGGKIYLNGDNELIRKKAPEYPNAVLYGLNEGNHYRATDISVSDRGTEFTVTAPDGETQRFSMKLLGEHNVQNVLGAIAYAHGTGISLDKLTLPVKRIAAVPHRLQLLDKGGNMTFIDDAYNSNPSGCRAALNVLGLFDACRILVTPGMVELGAKQEELNFEFGQEAAKACDHIVLVGKAQTVPIYNGIKDAGYDMDNVFVADSLGEALDHVRAYQTDKKKIVLLENDLPDNY